MIAVVGEVKYQEIQDPYGIWLFWNLLLNIWLAYSTYSFDMSICSNAHCWFLIFHYFSNLKSAILQLKWCIAIAMRLALQIGHFIVEK